MNTYSKRARQKEPSEVHPRAHVRSVQPAPSFPYVWRWHWTELFPFERFGRRCRILSNLGIMATIEFEDGFQIVAGRSAVRKTL